MKLVNSTVAQTTSLHCINVSKLAAYLRTCLSLFMPTKLHRPRTYVQAVSYRSTEAYTTIGSLRDPVTWYGINNAETHFTQELPKHRNWNQSSRLSFVLKVLLCHLHPCIINSVPCDRIMLKAPSTLAYAGRIRNRRKCFPFTLHQRKLKTKIITSLAFGFLFEKTRARECRIIISFLKSTVFKDGVFLSQYNANPAFPNSPGFKRVFSRGSLFVTD